MPRIHCPSSRLPLFLAACALPRILSPKPLTAQDSVTKAKLAELDTLGIGLAVRHTPNPVYARSGGRSRYRYTWLYRTGVSVTGSDTVTITEFGAFGWIGKEWVSSNFTRKPFTTHEFADWYACLDGRIAPGHQCSDSLNWTGNNALRASRSRWYYIGVTRDGRRVKGEAIVDLLAAMDTSSTH